MRVVMQPIDHLPEAVLRADAGPVSATFLERGIATFHGACAWVQALPYGCNTDTYRAMGLFDDGRGTCVTKHGVIAKLGAECGLDIQKNLGFYRLDETIVTGVADVLRPHGLTFVPTAHCFLESGSVHVDLTEGNCTGKNILIEEYDFVVRIPAEEDSEVGYRRYRYYLEQYAAIEPGLAALASEALMDLVRACHAQMERRRCAVAEVELTATAAP
jgi:hypothetical protein